MVWREAHGFSDGESGCLGIGKKSALKNLINVKKQKTTKQKRQGSEQRLYVASERTSHINPTTSSERTPGMDVSHGVTGGDKDGKVDYVADNAKANKALAQSIGGKVTSDVSSPTAGGIEETTNGGLKRDYYSKGLYKKAR